MNFFVSLALATHTRVNFAPNAVQLRYAMTNRYQNWERLVQVIEWSGMTVNHFACEIGLNRAENLYHIKKGNYGISLELANRIVARFPEIDLTWLLSGVGCMLVEARSDVKTLPYFKQDISQVLLNIDYLTPSETINFPYFVDCSCVVRSLDRAMNETLAVASDLFLREVEIVDVIQGNEYVLLFDGRVEWRRVRYVARDTNKLRLVARNREEYPDSFVDRPAIRRAWRVVARMAILES